MALVRPSDLARSWELHPRTVLGWIKDGRLPAIKTPGAQYRLRESDVRTFCEKNSLPLPRALALASTTIAYLGKGSPQQKALSRACRAHAVTLRSHTSVLDGMLAIATEPPAVVVLDSGSTPDLLGAVRALKSNARTERIPIVVVDVPRPRQGRAPAASPKAPVAGPTALTKAGATKVFVRPRPADESENAAMAATEIVELARRY